MFKGTIISMLMIPALSFSHSGSSPVSEKSQRVLVNLDQAQALGGKILSQDPANNLAVAQLDSEGLERLSDFSHFQGRCGGFEVLSENEAKQPENVLRELSALQLKMNLQIPFRLMELQWNEKYQKLADQAHAEGLRETVEWISSYSSRNDRLEEPNRHVVDLKKRLQEWLQGAPWPFQIEEISHKTTKQRSLRLTIPGKARPQEVVVLGGHFDSVNHSYFGNTKAAPGADDNASGSANLIEAVKVLKNSAQPERTLEFYWYAGEESGLLGSAEIAKAARAESKQVIGVLQLDMTLFPGSGEQVIGLVSDYTSPWLRDVLTRLNDLYVKARFVDDQCGYACSDHASWHRQNFHAVIPFEAVTRTMNRNIHTDRDLIDSRSSFEHSNSFTKYAILFALVLGNSDFRPPVR